MYASVIYDILDQHVDLSLRSANSVKTHPGDGSVVEFVATALMNIEGEVNYVHNGGILHTVLSNLIK